MNVAYEIYQLISKAAGLKIELSGDMEEGITAYIADNGLDSILERCPANRRTAYLNMFMRPILTMPSGDILIYFETYNLRKQFNLAANRIHAEAGKKWTDCKYQCANLEAIVEDFHTLVGKVSRHPSLYKQIAVKISDCTIELEYLAGTSQNISPEMVRRFGIGLNKEQGE